MENCEKMRGIDLERLDGIMLQMGFRDCLKGTPMFREAVQLRAWHPERKLIDDIFPEIAVKHYCTRACVERNIRTAIHCACESCPAVVLREIFGGSLAPGEIPTNSLCIARLAKLVEYLE